jgi:CHAD domain-containing protein
LERSSVGHVWFPKPAYSRRQIAGYWSNLQGESASLIVAGGREALLSSAQLVDGVAQRMHMLPPSRLVRADLAKAVKRAYRTSRRAMTVATQERSRDRLHEWRKQVKYFASQLKFLSPLMHKGLGNTYQKSLRLADCLGDDHDLALLHDKIIQHRRSGGAAVDALVHRLEQRRAKLQRKAYRRGRRLLDATARRLEARVRRRLRTKR